MNENLKYNRNGSDFKNQCSQHIESATPVSTTDQLVSKKHETPKKYSSLKKWIYLKMRSGLKLVSSPLRFRNFTANVFAGFNRNIKSFMTKVPII